MRVPRALSRLVPFRRWLAGGLGLLFPPLCASCSAEIPAEHTERALLCDSCRKELLARDPSTCPHCGMPYQDLTGQLPKCPSCRRQPPRFSEVVSLGPYEQSLRLALLRVKGVHEEPLAAALGELLWERRRERLESLKPDVITPIPMHWFRRLERGTNSPQTLAETLARHLRVPCHSRMLVRRRSTEPQGPLPRPARARNVRRAFAHRKRFPVAGRRVLLVDDILTTGATAGAATRVLLRAGALDVAVVVVGRADGHVMNDA